MTVVSKTPVRVPPTPPVLTPRAARALLRILVAADERRRIVDRREVAA